MNESETQGGLNKSKMSTLSTERWMVWFDAEREENSAELGELLGQESVSLVSQT